MTSYLKFLLGVAAVILVGFIATRTEYLPGSLASAQRDLQQKANKVLAVDAPWANVRLDGQKAVLSGKAPSEEALKKAETAVVEADWPGGLILGGVTAVDMTAATVQTGPPVANPFTWIAERQDDEIVLSGYAPSEAARDAVYQLAAMRFPDTTVSGDLEIAAGAPPEDGWVTAASFSLQALTRIDAGAVEAEGARFKISGVAENDAEIDAARQLMALLPDGFEGVVSVALKAPEPAAGAIEGAVEAPASKDDITTQATEIVETTAAPVPEVKTISNAPETAADAAKEAAPEPVAAAITPSPSTKPQTGAADPCRRRLEEAAENAFITFASAHAELDIRSQAHLRIIAVALYDCPQYSLGIVGHTDSSGDAERNRQLSLERADAVAAYLRSVGVDAARLEPRGLGADQPLVSNDTPEGRAQNRRIEFAVIGPKE